MAAGLLLHTREEALHRRVQHHLLPQHQKPALQVRGALTAVDQSPGFFRGARHHRQQGLQRAQGAHHAVVAEQHVLGALQQAMARR